MIDDDQDHLLLCKLVFEKRGYEVMTLRTCHDIIGIANEFKPALIFVDQNMPGITGSEIAKTLKSNPPTSHIPVIYFSSCNDIIKEAQEAGADAYSKKPFNF